MKVKVRKIDLSADEFIAGVIGLGPELLGTYWAINLLVYSSGRTIDDDDPRLFAMLGVHRNRLARLISDLEIRGKLQRNGNQIGVKRALNEIEKAEKRIISRQMNGALGGRPKGKQDDTEPNGSPTKKLSLTTTTNYHHQEEDSPPITPLAGGDVKSQRTASNGRTRGSRLPPDWQPSVEDREFAIECGLEPDNAAAEFRDYWLSEGGARAAKLDWSRTFRNRCRQLQRSPPNGRYREQPSTGRSRSPSIVDAARSLIDRMRVADGRSDEDG